MNTNDNCKPTDQAIEDLTVEKGKAEEVKGGRAGAPSVSEIVVTKDLD